MAAVHQEKERIRTITNENRKLIERLVETKSSVENSEPRKKAAYHVQAFSSKNKARRIESLNLVNRLKESERIMEENAKNKQWLQNVKPMIDVKKQLADHKKSKKMQKAMQKPLDKFYVSTNKSGSVS